MPRVVAVRLRYMPKELWFDPGDFDITEGTHVVVKTERGTTIGLALGEPFNPDKKLTSPLQPVVRLADESDFARADELADKGAEAMPLFRKLIKKHELDIKPIAIEYQLAEERATFYFAADERVDFRALVRELASELHIRVDMRQVGVRDEAVLLGGIAHCGQELCCTRMGTFQSVSVRMAKEQDLPLNPSKISGVCGHLMCCLRYEFETYRDFKKRAPKKKAAIETPLGMATVVEFDTPREIVKLRLEDGQSLDVPLGSMEADPKPKGEEGNPRPCRVTQEALDDLMEDLHQDETLMALGNKSFSTDPELADTTAKGGAVERKPRRRSNSSSSQKASSPQKKQGKKNGSSQKSKSAQNPPKRDSARKRRSVSVSGGDTSKDQGASKNQNGSKNNRGKSSQQGGGRQGQQPRRRRRNAQGSTSGNGTSSDGKANAGKQNGAAASGSKPRPGQHSSTLSPDYSNQQPRTSSSGGKNKGSGQNKSGQHNKSKDS
ncbi:MAG: hypothetical protein LUD25_02760 [Coriobacteriaceae bacterium]|nr:hypothetical protein [Coriobacteriaceae bacterium]